MKTVFNIILAACMVGLLYLCYESIMGPIQFNKEKDAREELIKARLIDIRKAQVEYRGFLYPFVNRVKYALHRLTPPLNRTGRQAEVQGCRR